MSLDPDFDPVVAYIRVYRLYYTRGESSFMILHGIWYALHVSAGSYYTVSCSPSCSVFRRVLSPSWIVFRSPYVCPIFYANNDIPGILYNVSSRLLALPLARGCNNTLVPSVLRLTLRCRGTGARLSLRAMVPFPIMMNLSLINPRWRTYIDYLKKYSI